eukprot:CAMPEP_0172793028 /NCGR_PEP_ID=MMETSP1074-20121228/209267_1 /TAXON_ID=2916 /ORGANISM="Ceratium fusus, Strain PA161109" /LENGTH=135 /DNA_ID=CAMNT_0013630099 /DNA_START=681 /DNA_END=1089 /DNA_ORIENTATION=+
MTHVAPRAKQCPRCRQQLNIRLCLTEEDKGKNLTIELHKDSSCVSATSHSPEPSPIALPAMLVTDWKGVPWAMKSCVSQPPPASLAQMLVGDIDIVDRRCLHSSLRCFGRIAIKVRPWVPDFNSWDRTASKESNA